MIRNPYQEALAERSLVIEHAEEGEYWTFHWYVDPILNGMAKWHRFVAHINPDGKVEMIGLWFALDEEQILAQEQALQFAQDRFQRVGLEEEELDETSGD